MDPITISAIASGLSSGLSYLTGRQNMKRQQRQNEQDRQWELDMYNRQRGHALEDRDYQNWYNSPAQMMQRLREAKLSPHVMMAGGAEMTGSLTRSVNASPSSKPAPQMDRNILPEAVSSMLMNANAVWQGKHIQAQTDNLAVQNEVLQKEAMLKAAQTWKTIAETDKSKQDYGQASRMNDLIYKDMVNAIKQRELDIEHKPKLMALTDAQTQKTWSEIDKIWYESKNIQQATRKMEAETKFVLTQNEIHNLMKQPNLNLAIQELYLKRAHTIKEEEEIKLLMEKVPQAQIDTAIKEIELKLREKGISPSDPYYFRVYAQFWSNYVDLWRKIFN